MTAADNLGLSKGTPNERSRTLGPGKIISSPRLCGLDQPVATGWLAFEIALSLLDFGLWLGFGMCS
jgi:hypothetical protein